MLADPQYVPGSRFKHFTISHSDGYTFLDTWVLAEPKSTPYYRARVTDDDLRALHALLGGYIAAQDKDNA